MSYNSSSNHNDVNVSRIVFQEVVYVLKICVDKLIIQHLLPQPYNQSTFKINSLHKQIKKK